MARLDPAIRAKHCVDVDDAISGIQMDAVSKSLHDLLISSHPISFFFSLSLFFIFSLSVTSN